VIAVIEFTIDDLKQIFVLLFKNKLLIILVTAAGFFAGMLFTARYSEAYEYETTVTLSVVFGQNLGQITGNTVISGYTDIVTSNLVGEHAAALLADEGLTGEQIQRMVSVSTGSSSFILRITARNASPRIAILVANAVAESFVAQVSIITGSNTIQVLDPARSAETVYLGGSRSIRLFAPVGAFVFVCLLLIIVELSMGKVRSVRQCIVDDGELLAVIPKVKRVRRLRS